MNLFSQPYGTINYMGKKIPITAEFFKSLNGWVEAKGYSGYPEIYSEIVRVLKSSSTTVRIDEAKQVYWTTDVDYPYCKDCKEKKWKKKIANTIIYEAVLPCIDFYERNSEFNK